MHVGIVLTVAILRPHYWKSSSQNQKRGRRLQMEIGRMISGLHMQISWLLNIFKYNRLSLSQTLNTRNQCSQAEQHSLALNLALPGHSQAQSHVLSRTLHICCPLAPATYYKPSRILSSAFSRSKVAGSCVQDLRKVLLFFSVLLCFKSSWSSYVVWSTPRLWHQILFFSTRGTKSNPHMVWNPVK